MGSPRRYTGMAPRSNALDTNAITNIGTTPFRRTVMLQRHPYLLVKAPRAGDSGFTINRPIRQ